MAYDQNLLAQYSDEFNKLYKKRKIILSFKDFTNLVAENPKLFIRDASHYLSDVFHYHGEEKVKHLDLLDTKKFLLFEKLSEKEKNILGCEKVQNEVFHSISKFRRKGYVDKLILLYGPSASSKSLTVSKIAAAMENYSKQTEGAVYKFNWIFPVTLERSKKGNHHSNKIGFGHESSKKELCTFAFLDENQILAKIHSEFKENPLFLIPMPFRENFLRTILASEEGVKEEDVNVPTHLLSSGLSKKNQEILANMLHIYEGDLTKVFRHIQVERFFYSSQYRVGISSIDPQMPMDAYEKQITINGNYHKIPPYLHDINFHESYGELVEGNRGLVEYSDLLARPLSHIKQLLSTIERRFIKLTSSTAKLDIVYMATTDDKHMEAFHATPEFHFFKGRFEEITVPYLLRPTQEKGIYEKDLSALRKEIDVAPYTLDLLVLWAIMSRIKPSNLNRFKEDTHALLQRLTPEAKLKLYEGESLLDFFTEKEEKIIHGLRKSIWEDGQDAKIYEGRFGPSPRDLVALLHKSAEKAKDGTLTAIEIFNEILEFTKEKNIYEFLQFAPQGQYHNQEYFLDVIKEKYKKNFEEEIASAMLIANKEEYRLYLERYIKHVVAYIKNQKLHDKATNTYEVPSRELMANIEEILNIQRPIEEYRSNLLSKIAAYKIENPGIDIKIESLFKTELEKIKKHFFVEQKKIIESNYDLILRYFQPEKNSPLSESEEKIVALTFENMKTEFGYNKKAIQKSVYFILNR